jgi:phycobilisome rod-core linker protein
MPIPLLEYAPSSQNSRISGYEVGSDEQPRVFSTDNLLSPTQVGDLIEAAYRQIFFHAFAADREKFLESQLRSGQITVRDFIRGLCLSNTFTNSFYNLNSNYRFVEQCVQRVLGRPVYNEAEKIAWSIVVATKGRAGFINDILNSNEYLENFGDSIVPFQRRRVLPSGASALPFNIQSPRYTTEFSACPSKTQSRRSFDVCGYGTESRLSWQSTSIDFRFEFRLSKSSASSLGSHLAPFGLSPSEVGEKVKG